MKAIFFSILMFNTVFFLWEYRQGAPEIYYPQEAVEVLTENTEQIIFLSSEAEKLGLDIEIAKTDSVKQESLVMTENTHTEESIIALNKKSLRERKAEKTEAIILSKKSEALSAKVSIEEIDNSKVTETPATLVKEESTILVNKESIKDNIGPVVKENEIEKMPKNLVTKLDIEAPETSKIKVIPIILVNEDKVAVENKVLCFQVFDQDLEVLQQKIKGYQFSVIKKISQSINYYFLLTKRSQSLETMESNARVIKQQGLDTWLIKKGEFRQRISLGVFSNPENVKNAKIAYMKKIHQPLEIIPQYKNKEKIYLKITVLENKVETLMTALGAYKLEPKQCNLITNSKVLTSF